MFAIFCGVLQFFAAFLMIRKKNVLVKIFPAKIFLAKIYSPRKIIHNTNLACSLFLSFI